MLDGGAHLDALSYNLKKMKKKKRKEKKRKKTKKEKIFKKASTYNFRNT